MNKGYSQALDGGLDDQDESLGNKVSTAVSSLKERKVSQLRGGEARGKLQF